MIVYCYDYALDFRARYYGSALGRFTSVDPVWINDARLLDPQRLNFYAYVRNNPLRLIDADGRDIALGNCPANATISMCEVAIKNGVPKADRDHIHLVKGDGKNGFGKGQWGIQVDKDYKSTSGNFSTLQTLANDHSGLARVDILQPSDNYSVITTTGFDSKKGASTRK